MNVGISVLAPETCLPDLAYAMPEVRRPQPEVQRALTSDWLLRQAFPPVRSEQRARFTAL